MTWFSRRVALGGLLVVGTFACELIVGIGDGPHAADGAAGGDAEAGAPGCTLPTAGDAKVRLANLVPSLDKYDFCLTPTGSQPQASGVLASSGAGCPAGLLYRNVLAPIAVRSGSYRVDAIAPGSPCTSTPLASAPSVNFEPATTTTVVLFGTSGGAQLQLKAFREELGTGTDSKVRFINGWSDGPSSLDCGQTTGDELPATILGSQLFCQNANFANVAPPSTMVDAQGYFTMLGGITVPFGFAETGKGGSTGVAVSRNMTSSGSISNFAIGTSADARFPVDLMVCNQQQVDGIYTRCSNQVADDVIVDVYNLQLPGRFTPAEPERRAPLATAVAGLDADFACITGVWNPTDRAAIVTAAKAHFPFVAMFTTDLNTVAADPRDQQGNVPPPYTTPRCDSVSGANLQTFLTCMAANCTTGASNDPNGQFPEFGTQCIFSHCAGEGALLLGAPTCFTCAINEMESGATFGDTQTACTTNPLARYAWNGGTGMLLLSTHPFLKGAAQPDAGAGDGGTGDGGGPSDDAPGLFVFPSTEYRAATIRAPVDLSAGSGVSTKLDVYCTVLTNPTTNTQQPYTGQYGGNGATSADQWVNENLLQAKQLTDYVTRVSGARKRRAILAGDYFAGPGTGDLQALNQASYDLLTKVLPLAVAPDYTPACTLCGSNPLVSTAGGATSMKTWSSYSLLSDLALPEVLSNKVILTDLTATTGVFGGDAGNLAIPPSFYFGMRTVVRVRP